MRKITLALLALLQPFPAGATDPIPKCWKASDPKLYDGLYHITIPANETLTAKDVQTMLLSLQAYGVASHTVMAVGDSAILLEAQFWTLDQAKAFGYPTQEKLEGLVADVLRNDVPYLAKGVTISCFKGHKQQPHGRREAGNRQVRGAGSRGFSSDFAQTGDKKTEAGI